MYPVAQGDRRRHRTPWSEFQAAVRYVTWVLRRNSVSAAQVPKLLLLSKS